MKKILFPFLGSLLILLTYIMTSSVSGQAAGIRVVVNGTELSLNPKPFIKDGRTLIPLRALFESLQATVEWEGPTQTVTAQRGDRFVRFQIGGRFACLERDCRRGALMDVPAQLTDTRTFVPLRFVSNALGAQVAWDDATQTVTITDPATGPISPSIALSAPPAIISGSTTLKVSTFDFHPTNVQFYLLNRDTKTGPLLGTADQETGELVWKPDPALNGKWYLIGVGYDIEKKPLYTESREVEIDVHPTVKLSGITEGAEVRSDTNITVDHDFAASKVEYRLFDAFSGEETFLGLANPEKPFRLVPLTEQAGTKFLQASVFDRNNTKYETEKVKILLRPEHSFSQEGLADGKNIAQTLSIRLYANFPIKKSELLSDNEVVKEWGRPDKVSLSNISPQYVTTLSFRPKVHQNGHHTLLLRIYDENGAVYDTAGFSMDIAVEPVVLLSLGKNQVVSDSTEIYVTSYVSLQSVDYVLLDGGKEVVLGTNVDPYGSITYTPPANTKKTYEMFARATGTDGKTYQTDRVSFSVVTTKTFGATPLVEKSKFRALIEPLAKKTQDETGMAASIQMAQAILESGWGQYVPTDKYTGQVSNNLFGIKGTGSAGSVISNTSEVYGGLRYRIEALFRAYKDVSESWQDHADLLLTRSWYAPFRATMQDPVRGAWGLYESGYATAPDYAVKLIDLMRQQKLFELDWRMP